MVFLFPPHSPPSHNQQIPLVPHPPLHTTHTHYSTTCRHLTKTTVIETWHVWVGCILRIWRLIGLLLGVGGSFLRRMRIWRRRGVGRSGLGCRILCFVWWWRICRSLLWCCQTFFCRRIRVNSPSLYSSYSPPDNSTTP